MRTTTGRLVGSLRDLDKSQCSMAAETGEWKGAVETERGEWKRAVETEAGDNCLTHSAIPIAGGRGRRARQENESRASRSHHERCLRPQFPGRTGGWEDQGNQGSQGAG